MSFNSRDKIIIRTGIVGVLTNIILATCKVIIGFMANSISVILDAVNNYTDALSSLITIIGAGLANKEPDHKHPLGHGRIEYLSAMLVSALILYAGITSLIESIKKMIHPVKPEYTLLSLFILSIAIVVKIILGKYVKNKGVHVNSGALIASGKDAIFDALIAFSVLISAILFMVKGISLEAYLGTLIALFIIKSGIDMILTTLDDILGKRADSDNTRRIREILEAMPDVIGAYDLILNNYGPDKNYASVQLELPDVMTVQEVDLLTRKAQESVYNKTGVVLTAVGVYSHNTKGGKEAEIKEQVQEVVMSHHWALQLHGFYVNLETKVMRFDVVMSFDIDHNEGAEILEGELKMKYPDMDIKVSPDLDISD